jgi:hypothetical protein
MNRVGADEHELPPPGSLGGDNQELPALGRVHKILRFTPPLEVIIQSDVRKSDGCSSSLRI